MSEPGSDRQFAEYGDLDDAAKPLRNEEAKLAAEEERVRNARPSDNEPGREYPAPGIPDPKEPHPEYRTLP